MEEEELDYSSEIGQLIQRMQKLCKKPQIDNQLSSALDLFQEKVTRQHTYLNNGIFNINFAEAALFIQSCAELYGKKIDLLWDQLLEFHTRLIEYDCQHEQEKGKKVAKEVIEKLEERRNRYKRKKKFKLLISATQQSDRTILSDYLFDEAIEELESIPFKSEPRHSKAWRKLEYESFQITKIPKSVYKLQTTYYRLKNYYIMKSEDFDILDLDDNEFNTKYSRIPGWHFIEHLFEYNTQGLLPDRDRIIATLRLCCYLRAQFMRDNNIPFNAPYSQYKKQYLKFKRQFFEEEEKKWQNMPLDTMADLRRQLEYLAKTEREANGEKFTKLWIDIPPFTNKKCDLTDCSDCSDDSKSTVITIADSIDYDDSFSDKLKTDGVDSCLEPSSDNVDPKLRQDSGFFDGESLMETSICENDKIADSANELELTEETTNNAETEKSTQAENETDNTTVRDVTHNGTVPINEDVTQNTLEVNSSEPQQMSEVANQVSLPVENSGEADKINNVENQEMPEVTNQVSSPTENSGEADITNNVENQELPEVANQVSSPIENSGEADKTNNVENHISLPTENSGEADNTNNVENQTKEIEKEPVPNENLDKENVNPINDDDDDENFDVISIMSDHDYCAGSDQVNILTENTNRMNKQNSVDMMVPMSTKSRIIPKVVKMKLPKENKLKDDLMGPPPSKIRKLSQKQIDKLLTSKVTPVKEIKFEKFFSMNYQPQIGEGHIEEVDYESEEEIAEEEPPPELVPEPLEQEAVEPSKESASADLTPEIEPESVVQPQSPVHDNDDLRSIVSDHSYCQFPDVPNANETANDSAFIDNNETIGNVTSLVEETDGYCTDDEEEALRCRYRPRPPRGPVDPEYLEEYERLLAEFREEQRKRCEELNIDPNLERMEYEKRQQEKIDSRRRVEEWRETITPILNNLKEKDFDIHQYGTRIMDGMQVNESKPFKDIVDGKSSAEVVRFFIASLQLANTYNIEICGAKSGELSNDTYNVKLLKTDRYHEHLVDYHAPSEETFRERIKRLRDLQNTELPDTCNIQEEPMRKRQRVDTSPNKGRRRRRISSSDDDDDNDYEPEASVSFSNYKNERRYRSKRAKVSLHAQPNPFKGKNIVVKLTPIINTIISSPSTSGFDSCNVSSQFDGSSQVYLPDPDQENFEAELQAAQEKNPEMQLFSTPSTLRESRCMAPTSSKTKLLFE